jgi:type VI secretion system secreted protein Hcp
MPIPAHMELTGNNQGKIDGSCDLAGREGTILIYGEEHGVSMPRDTHSGLPTGKRVHHPLVVTKSLTKVPPSYFRLSVLGNDSQM